MCRLLVRGRFRLDESDTQRTPVCIVVHLFVYCYSFSFVCVSWTKFVWNAASEGVMRNAFSLAVGHNNIIRALLLIILRLR